jgi:hypothetical protein
MHRELLHRGSMIARPFLLLSRDASNMRCLYALPADQVLSGKEDQVIKTRYCEPWLAPTAHTGMLFREVALSRPRNTHLSLGSGIK